MSGTTWIVVTDHGVTNLLAMARAASGDLVAVVAGPRELADDAATAGVAKVLWIDVADAPAEAFSVEAAKTLRSAEGQPGLVLAASGPQDRVLLGAIAAHLQCPLLTGAHTITADGDALLVQRAVFGGVAEQTDRVVGPVALMLEGGAALEAGGGEPAVVEALAVSPSGLTVTEVRQAQYEAVDLAAATRVVTAGRGVKAKEDLTLVENLAGVLGAEVACSRPLAEGLDWYPKDRYVGVSGAHLTPKLYVAVGVSGQLQHMVGARQADVIVAVNSDKTAPIFSECDYGVVGDLYAVVPALTKALS